MKTKVDKIKLKNGGRLINIINKDLEVSLVSVWYRAGSRFDPFEKEGLAHFMEHVFMKRTSEESEIDRLSRMESLGINFNAFTDYETAHYYHIQPKESTYKSLEILLDGMENTVIDDSDVASEKKIVINESMDHKQDSREYLWNISNQGLWKGSALGRDFFGSKESIESLSVEDVKEFMQNLYKPENSLFVVMGNENTRDVERFINDHTKEEFGDTTFIEESFESPIKVNVVKNNEDQANIALSYRTLEFNDLKEIVLSDFIRDCLANKWSSGLVKSLRLKEGLTYWVDGETANFSDTGMIRFLYSVQNSMVIKSIGLALREIESLKKINLSESNLAAHKNYFISSVYKKMLDPYEVMWWYGWQALVNPESSIFTIDEYIDVAKNIKPYDILKFSKEFLKKENFSVSIIGNVENSDEIEKYLEERLI